MKEVIKIFIETMTKKKIDKEKILEKLIIGIILRDPFKLFFRFYLVGPFFSIHFSLFLFVYLKFLEILLFL